MYFNIPHPLKKYLSDKDREFINKRTERLYAMDLHQRAREQLIISIVNAGTIWELAMDNGKKYRKVFKRLEKEYNKRGL